MSEVTGSRLYDLLPAVYRRRDAERGEPLRALLSVIEREVVIVESDIAHLYDDWFVETASEWAVSYLGDLLGVRGLAAVDGQVVSQRAFVANAIGYRRRKGTASVLEQLARDVTGWPAHVTEYFLRLGWNQYSNHVRPSSLRTPDLRDTNALALLPGPLGSATHTVDVRHIDRRRGRFNIPNIGLHLWRLQPYAVEDATARPVGAAGEARYTFDPLGRDLPLFNTPRTELEATQISHEENLPMILRRRSLSDELEAWRQAIVDDAQPAPVYFRSSAPGPVFEVTVDDELLPLPPESVLICNLADWTRPKKTLSYRRSLDGDEKRPKIRVAVDPVLGRLTYPKDVDHERTRVSFAYGFGGDIGGGPYDRRASLRAAQAGGVADWRDEEITWQRGVSSRIAPVPDEIVPSITEAVKAWNAQPPGTVGVIAVMDSASYVGDLTGSTRTIRIPEGSKLLVVAANWPAIEDPNVPGGERRDIGRYVPAGLRPHLQGNLSVAAPPGSGAAPGGGVLIVDGLLIEGQVNVLEGDLAGLVLSNSTIVPGEGGLVVAHGSSVVLPNSHLAIELRRTISGRVVLADETPRLSVVDSIVDASWDGGTLAITARGAALDVQTSTVLGQVAGRTLDAGNSIFQSRVTITRRQVGCVRFCYLGHDSITPRRYHCQPTETAGKRVAPQYTSLQFGQPGYVQLTVRCPSEITEGAEDEGEMGAFHFLQAGRRVRNLSASLDQYLRLGMEAGIFLES